MIRGQLRFSDGQVKLIPGGEGLAPPSEGLLWVDLQDQTAEELSWLGEIFGFHPLALEDCEHLDQRPKLEAYADHAFLVLQAFTPLDDADVTCHELHVFFNERYLVTVHATSIPILDGVWNRAAQDARLFAKGIDFLLYLLCDELIDLNFPTVEWLTELAEGLEDAMIEGREAGLIHRLLGLKRTLSHMRRVLAPQRETFNQLLYRERHYVSPQTLLYFRDVYDHLVRLYEIIDSNRDLVANVVDAHFSVLSQRTNDIMRRLTLLSFMFLPLTFITGFFGMNFEGLPFAHPALLYGTLAAVVILPLAMLTWFWRKRWFN